MKRKSNRLLKTCELPFNMKFSILSNHGHMQLSRCFLDPRRYPQGYYKIVSVHPSVLPSVRLSRHFVGIVSSVFSEFWYGTRNPYKVVRDRTGFSGKNFLPKNLGKWSKNWPKTGFFEFIDRFGH